MQRHPQTVYADVPAAEISVRLRSCPRHWCQLALCEFLFSTIKEDERIRISDEWRPIVHSSTWHPSSMKEPGLYDSGRQRSDKWQISCGNALHLLDAINDQPFTSDSLFPSQSFFPLPLPAGFGPVMTRKSIFAQLCSQSRICSNRFVIDPEKCLIFKRIQTQTSWPFFVSPSVSVLAPTVSPSTHSRRLQMAHTHTPIARQKKMPTKIILIWFFSWFLFPFLGESVSARSCI